MDTLELLPVDEDDDAGPGLWGALMAALSTITAAVAVYGRPWFAWTFGDWSWRSWLVPAALVALAGLVGFYGWRRNGEMHPAAYPALMAGLLLLMAAMVAWRLS